MTTQKFEKRSLDQSDLEHEGRVLSYILGLELNVSALLDEGDLYGENVFKTVRVLREYDKDLQVFRDGESDYDNFVAASIGFIEACLVKGVPAAQEPAKYHDDTPSPDFCMHGRRAPGFMATQIEYQGSLGGGTPSEALKIGH